MVERRDFLVASASAPFLVFLETCRLWTPGQKQRTFRLNYKTKLKPLSSGVKHVRMWIPLAESNPYQEVTYQSTGNFAVHFNRDTTHKNALLYADVQDPGEKDLELKLEFMIKRKENVRVIDGRYFFPTGSELDPMESPKKWLKPNRLVPIDGRIQEVSDQVTRGIKSPLEKAEVIYQYVLENMTYDKSGKGWGYGDALYACDVKRGNCTDFHAFFVGLMRAQKIPARFEIGFQIPEVRGRGRISGYHCWSQFFMEGKGWIPVDISEAWKHPEKREYYFGALDENRVLFTFGRDLRLSPPQEGESLNYFIYPHIEVDGRPFNGGRSEFFYEDL